MAIVWLFPLLGAIIGAFTLLTAMTGSNGAPQQAAGAAIACGLCVVPYIAARAIQELLATGSSSIRAGQINNSGVSPAGDVASARPNTLGAGAMIAVAVLLLVILAVVAISMSASSETSGTSGTSEARQACLEFKAIFDTLSSPTASQNQTAAGCRAKGYW